MDLAIDRSISQSQAVIEDEYDEHHEHHIHRNSIHHRLRASSSIMQLKKILGAHTLLIGPIKLPG
jgi:pyruvate carboxylase